MQYSFDELIIFNITYEYFTIEYRFLTIDTDDQILI